MTNVPQVTGLALYKLTRHNRPPHRALKSSRPSWTAGEGSVALSELHSKFEFFRNSGLALPSSVAGPLKRLTLQ